MMSALLFCRTHRHQEEETVAKGCRVQEEKDSAALPSVWWTWYLFLKHTLNPLRHTYIYWQKRHQSYVALVHRCYVSKGPTSPLLCPYLLLSISCSAKHSCLLSSACRDLTSTFFLSVQDTFFFLVS